MEEHLFVIHCSQ